MTTTMDTDSGSQDSDDGRRFRFEATRKDATTALQARRRKASSPTFRSNSGRRSRSRDRFRHEKRDDRRKDFRSNQDDRRSSKDQKSLKEGSTKSDDSRHRDLKNSSHKDFRESLRRDSRSRDSRESKGSREDKRRRSRERNRDVKNRDRYRRHSREGERSQPRAKSQERDQFISNDHGKVKESNEEEIAQGKCEKVTDTQDCKDLNLSDFDIVSDTEGHSDDHSENKPRFRSSRRSGPMHERSSEEIHKVNPRNGDDRSTSPTYSNNDDISDFLLASTSAKSSCSHTNDNNKINEHCTELNEMSDVNSDISHVDDDYHSYGPILPPISVKKSPEVDSTPRVRVIGPSLPDHLKKCIEGDSDDSDDAFGPALPPHLQNKKSEIVGPQLPEDEDVLSFRNMQVDEDEEDIDGMGPLPADHPAIRDDLVQQQLEYRARMIKRELAEIDNNTEETKREEWMTELPSIQTAHLGLAPRKFRAKAGPDMSDRSSWTDTPADRVKKQKEKMMGKGSKDTEPEKVQLVERSKKRKEKSLLEMHQKKLQKKKKKEEKEAKKADKPVRRPFDREIDMQVNRFDEARKKTLFMKAAALDDRFSRGNI